MFQFQSDVNVHTGIFENLVGLNPDLATVLASNSRLFPWLLNRIQAKTHDENRGYAAELLSILLQNNSENRLQFGQKDGVETVLKVLSVRSSRWILKSPLYILFSAIPQARSNRCRRGRVHGERLRRSLLSFE